MADNNSYWNSSVNFNDSSNEDFFDGWEEAKTPFQVPAGKYNAVLTGWTPVRNSKGTPNLKFSYRIERGECAGQTITEHKALTKAAMGWTKKFCQNLGIDPRQSVSDYPKIWVELVTTVQDGANGNQYANVQSVRRIKPPEEQTPEQTSNPAAVSGQQSELPPGAAF